MTKVIDVYMLCSYVRLLCWMFKRFWSKESMINYFVCKLDEWSNLQYIPRNMHTVFALLCFVVVIHWLIFPYPSGLLHWHCGNLTIAPVPAKQPWWIWINTSCEFIMNDCITTTKQSTTKPCAYFLGCTVGSGVPNTDDLNNVLRSFVDDPNNEVRTYSDSLFIPTKNIENMLS